MTASVSFDRAADYYDATRGLPPSASEQVTNSILDIVAATPETQFLEVGIGTGRIALPIVKRGFTYTGVDISENMLNELRQKLAGESHQLTLLNADATNLPFEDASFDAILTVHVLHLIPDWRRALAEIRRVLKPGGIYLFSHGSINAQPHEVDVAQKRAEVDKQWKTILAGHGYELKNYGATGDEVVAELTAQGANLDVVVAARWKSNLTIAELLDRIENKLYSGCWQIPDDIFPLAIQDLRAWAQDHFGNLNHPLSDAAQFKLLVVRNWAAD